MRAQKNLDNEAEKTVSCKTRDENSFSLSVRFEKKKKNWNKNQMQKNEGKNENEKQLRKINNFKSSTISSSNKIFFSLHVEKFQFTSLEATFVGISSGGFLN